MLAKKTISDPIIVHEDFDIAECPYGNLLYKITISARKLSYSFKNFVSHKISPIKEKHISFIL